MFDRATYTLNVREDTPVGTSIVRVHAVDADSGQNAQVRYHIDRKRCDVRGQFEVDAMSGVIVITRPLDFEITRHHELIVVAADQGPQSLKTSAVVSVQVLPTHYSTAWFIYFVLCM